MSASGGRFGLNPLTSAALNAIGAVGPLLMAIKCALVLYIIISSIAL